MPLIFSYAFKLAILIWRIMFSLLRFDIKHVIIFIFMYIITLYMIITKISADRLALIAVRILSPQLFSFVKGRNISNCIVTVSKCVNILDKQSYGGNVALKIDIRRSFDTLSWEFLLKIFHSFG